MNSIGIIPARYASTRFPGKPLADIGGKSMVQHVVEQAQNALTTVYVATDDERIFNEVERFGGRAIMTSGHHQSGTDRCAEAVSRIESLTGKRFDAVVNIQGDEPFLRPDDISMLTGLLNDRQAGLATLVRAFGTDEDIFDMNKVKVVTDKSGYALYFSRWPIPFIRQNAYRDTWPAFFTYFQHIGLYAYRKEILTQITKLDVSPLEGAESLEQLRWLENGYRIKVGVTDYKGFGIDTPEDLERARVSEGLRKD